MSIYFQPAEELKGKISPLSFRVAWLFPQADLLNPSNRLRRYQISRYLNSIPYIESENFYDYTKEKMSDMIAKLQAFDVIVFFSISMFDQDLCRYLSEAKKIIIFDHCENIFGLGSEDAIMGWTSAITCCSTALAKLTEKYLTAKGCSKPIFVIRDPLDDLAPLPQASLQRDWALVMGMGGNVNYVLPNLESECDRAGYRIMILSEPGLSFPSKHIYKIWSPYSWIEDASMCSVALCCHDVARFPAKGNVKVTTPMSLGIPVIASPVESYVEAMEDRHSGYITWYTDDWWKRLTELKNPQIRYSMGLRARQRALANYSTEKIGLDYLSMLYYLGE
jgi:glycosyltransferase involved in cell wall biosynthesis